MLGIVERDKDTSEATSKSDNRGCIRRGDRRDGEEKRQPETSDGNRSSPRQADEMNLVERELELIRRENELLQ